MKAKLVPGIRFFVTFGFILCVLQTVLPGSANAALTQPRYYAHPAVHHDGVIAPWYTGQNGPWDLRVRIAAETLKRYPWAFTNGVNTPYPHYVFSGVWAIASNGIISPKVPTDWANGDLGQRATSVLNGFVDYYRYTGDPAAMAHVTYMADFIIKHCVTPSDHPWPGIFISVPVKGKAYGPCDPKGMIQLDLVASTGEGLLRAYQMTGDRRWYDTAKHWGDLLAQQCNLDPKSDPWPRYANPEVTPWKDNKQTGGVTMILHFLDELIRLGYTGRDGNLVSARDAGRRYLKEKLLPAWAVNDTWGRYFWDWVNPVQNCLTTPDATRYLLKYPSDFPGWKNDARNILTLFLQRSSVAPDSRGDVYSGAWAYPEACQCCGRSLWYAPICVAPVFAEYAARTTNAWCRELAWRQLVLASYDIHETGVTEDNIDGGVIVNGDWFNIAHPLAFRWTLYAMSWMPEELAPQRENHIVRSSGVVNSVRYLKGRIEYTTFDAPENSIDVLRLAFTPREIIAEGQALKRRPDLSGNGYTVKKIAGGDTLVAIRHDHARAITVLGRDPQEELASSKLEYSGFWQTKTNGAGSGHETETAGASVTARFRGNQVRLLGRADPSGGLADVYLDGEKQLVHIDAWNPTPRDRQVLYYRNGLSNGWHSLTVTARGDKNPYSQGTRIYIQGLQFSKARGEEPSSPGNAPVESQRMIFGYTGREDYRDSQGNLWRPATEFVTRLAPGKDTVAECWWTNPTREDIVNTSDPELYRYGVHAHDFWINLTTGPGTYALRLKFAATRGLNTQRNCFDVLIHDQMVVERLDVAATAGGPNRAADLVFNRIRPRNGVIEVRLRATINTEAFLQALELLPGSTTKGVKPVSALPNGKP